VDKPRPPSTLLHLLSQIALSPFCGTFPPRPRRFAVEASLRRSRSLDPLQRFFLTDRDRAEHCQIGEEAFQRRGRKPPCVTDERMRAGAVSDSTDRVAYLLARVKSLHPRDDQRVNAGVDMARGQVHVFRDDPLDPVFARRGRHRAAIFAPVPDEEPQVHTEEDDVENQSDEVELVHQPASSSTLPTAPVPSLG